MRISIVQLFINWPSTGLNSTVLANVFCISVKKRTISYCALFCEQNENELKTFECVENPVGIVLLEFRKPNVRLELNNE